MPMPDYPPTIVVRSPKENPKKCSILPLKGREDMLFFHYPLTRAFDWSTYVRLAPDAPPLTIADADRGLLLIDGSWRWAATMNDDFLAAEPRSLQGFATAYPRVSKLGTDPQEGLATIEALFLAYRIFGRPTQGLLDHYRWADDFLRKNNLS
jgi:pre-rRNA-processing protein TSR3